MVLDNPKQTNFYCLINIKITKSSGAQKAAKIGSEDATVQRVSAEVGSAHALLLDVNVTLMFAVIAGLGNYSLVHLPLVLEPSLGT